MNIGAIVAITKDGALGKGNDLPWPKGSIKGDLSYFKQTTVDSVVIMGRSTFESMGSKALPNRHNIVVSSTLSDTIDGIYVYDSIALALGFAVMQKKPIWFIGGANILGQVIDLGILDKISITRVKKDYEGDVFLPWDSDFLHDYGFIMVSSREISDGEAVIETWVKTDYLTDNKA